MRNLAKEIEVRKNSVEQVLQLNQQLVNTIIQLKNINEDLDNVADIASHDLQEPLRKIRMSADTLLTKDEMSLENRRDHLFKIKKSSKRMQLLIQDILDFSRFNTNVDAFKETDLNEIIGLVLTNLEMDSQEKNAIVEVKKLPVLPIVPGMFSQLFQNLIYNALKFQKKAGYLKSI